MTKKLSKWFAGDMKPWEPGVYERRLAFKQYGRSWPGQVYWDGEKWFSVVDGHPYQQLFDQPANRGWHFEWRGLAQPPERQKR